MKALSLLAPGDARVTDVQEPPSTESDLLLRVEMVGLCGTDLNSFRGNNPLITYPRVLGHEIAATVLDGNVNVSPGTQVTVAPYTNCGSCASCRRGRPNACQFNQTFGVQRDGALTEFLRVPEEKIYPRIRHGAYRGRDVLTALLAADREVAVPSLRKVEHDCQYRRTKGETTMWISPELSPIRSLRCVEMT